MLDLPRRVGCLLLGAGLMAAALAYGSWPLGGASVLAFAGAAWMWRSAYLRRKARALNAMPAPRPEEKALYEKMWSIPGYRTIAPGEQAAHLFLQVAKPDAGAEVLDLGCGTGRGSAQLASAGGLRVTMVDFARNCLDPDVRAMLESGQAALRFVEADLTRALPVKAEYGFCTDVMEHIAEDRVGDVLDNCLGAARKVFFQICTVEDSFGKAVGHPLHLTVRPFEWWRAQFQARGCALHWSEDQGANVLFYVSGRGEV
jgi:SAM-dependent methyltransferase